MCLPSCWPLVHLAEYLLCAGTLGGSMEEITMGQPQPSVREACS